MTPKIARTNYEPAFKAIRAAVLGRDGNQCVKCGSTLALEVHHIEGHERNEQELLITLCYLCHGVAPMGKAAFNLWMLRGERGIDALRQLLIKNGLTTLSREEILVFCRTLDEFGYKLRVSQLRKARERTRSTRGRCEGRKPFGARPGEQEALQMILDLRSKGEKGDNIAARLNELRVPTRGGKPWRGSVVRKIVAKNSPLRAAKVGRG